MNDDTPRELPHDTQAEQAVLGAMLLSNRIIDTVTSTIASPADFHDPHHETIYTAILRMYGDSTNPTIDPLTLTAHLRTTGDLDRIGGQAHLHRLVQTVPSVGHTQQYAEIVRECAQLRAVLHATLTAAQRAHRAELPATDILDEAMAGLTAAASGVTTGNNQLAVADRWYGFLEELEAGTDPNALDTPWPDLNDVIELKPGQLITIGAATAGGKSLLGMNLASHVALSRNKPVLVVSLEMGGSELMARLTAAEAGVKLDHLIRRQLTDADWSKVIKCGDRLQNAHNFILDDSPNLTISKIRARMRWMASRDMPPAMVVADYLQLMTPEKTRPGQNRAQEVAELSRGLKLLAMEFEVPVVALAQFNRGAAGRQPVVSDFKDSSAIEQDSNVIVLMHRPLAEDGSDTGPRAGEIDLIVAKNRNGAAGRVVTLSFQGHFARIRSMAPESWTPTTVIGGAA